MDGSGACDRTENPTNKINYLKIFRNGPLLNFLSSLVVDSKGFNGKTWLDQAGKPTTDALHVIERFRRKDFGHMDIEITIDGPKSYTKSWTVTEQAHLLPDTELMEFICNENNIDLEHLKRNSVK